MGEGKRRILVFTGEGKGKTTAALGMLLRASGHGLPVLMIQFVKADASTGELAAAERLPGVKVVQTGRGFVPPPTNPRFAEHVEAAQKGLCLAEEALAANTYALVILDEICVAVAKGLLDEQRVVNVSTQAPGSACLVLTGRDATPALLALADTVTEMRAIKHGMQSGWEKQAGVEY